MPGSSACCLHPVRDAPASRSCAAAPAAHALWPRVSKMPVMPTDLSRSRCDAVVSGATASRSRRTRPVGHHHGAACRTAARRACARLPATQRQVRIGRWRASARSSAHIRRRTIPRFRHELPDPLHRIVRSPAARSPWLRDGMEIPRRATQHEATEASHDILHIAALAGQPGEFATRLHPARLASAAGPSPISTSRARSRNAMSLDQLDEGRASAGWSLIVAMRRRCR